MTIRMIQRRSTHLLSVVFVRLSYNGEALCEDSAVIAHWDEAEAYRAELGHLAARWTDLGLPGRAPTVLAYEPEDEAKKA